MDGVTKHCCLLVLAIYGLHAEVNMLQFYLINEK